ncbi:MAG: HlyD family efflux transporter periplasmic adaptor subunit [Cyclobacteriaceae bacterium]|nr:HlyD family efflux transporter periplasmic adaptor subunit [Cyclobacteriaceae bacterium]
MNKRKIFVSTAGLVLIGLSLYFSGVLGSMAEPPKKSQPKAVAKFVKTVPVKYSDTETQITAYGRVRTAQSLDMIAEVSGRMMQGAVSLKEGQAFRKGTLLFRIDDEESRLNLQSQKSNFLKDLASILPDIKVDYPTEFDVWQNYFSSIQIEKSLPELPDYNSDKIKTFLATRNILSTYYSIKSQESRLKKHNFYAPFSGNIYSINLQSGSFVNPGSNIGKLIRSDKLELKVDVGASEISWIELGSKAGIYSENETEWIGTVSRIGEFVNQNTQSIDVFISIDANDHPLYDGQFLRAIMPTRNISNSMLIPRSIIFNRDEVFVVEDTVLRVEKIKIFKVNEETVVMGGLTPGTDLVIEPLVNAYNGMSVSKLEASVKDIPKEPVGKEVVKESLSN